MFEAILSQIINGIIIGSLYGVIGLAVTLTFSITGVVNFAFGAYMVVGAYLTWWLTATIGLPYVLAVLAATTLLGVMGLIIDKGLFVFTRNNLVNGLLVSIGLIFIIEGLILLQWTSTPKQIGHVLSGNTEFLKMQFPTLRLVILAILVFITMLTYWISKHTWLGRATLMYAQNPEAAQLMGIRTKTLQSYTVIYSAVLTGLGGGLYAALYSLEPSIGFVMIIKAVEGAILSGIGSIIGALAGGWFIGISESIGTFFLPLAYQDIYGLVLLVAILLFKPNGLFGGKQ